MSLQDLKDTLRRRILEEKGFTEEEGLTTCPNCGKHYKPRYRSKEEAPAGTIWFEQHMTGTCSDRCWREFLGGTP